MKDDQKNNKISNRINADAFKSNTGISEADYCHHEQEQDKNNISPDRNIHDYGNNTASIDSPCSGQIRDAKSIASHSLDVNDELTGNMQPRPINHVVPFLKFLRTLFQSARQGKIQRISSKHWQLYK